MQVEPLLLHGDTGVVQVVFAIRKLRLAVQYLGIEVLVAQHDDDVSLLYRRALFDQPLLDHAALQRGQLKGCDRLNGALHLYVIVEQRLACGAGRDGPAVDN